MVERGKGGRGSAGVVQASSLSHSCLHLVTGRWWFGWVGGVCQNIRMPPFESGLPNPMRYKSNGWKISELGDREHVVWPASLALPALVCEEGGRAAVAACPPVTALCWLSREPYSAPLPAR